MITVGSAGTGMTGSPAEIIAGASGCRDLSRIRELPSLASATFRIRLIMERGLMRQRISPGSEFILEEGERDKLGEATLRAPQGPGGDRGPVVGAPRRRRRQRSGCGRRRDRRPASLRSRAPILPGRAISVVRRESLSATLSPVVHSIPEDNWVSAEAEALLDATPGLREDLRAAMDELHAGTLQTVDAATARARIEARIKSRRSS